MSALLGVVAMAVEASEPRSPPVEPIAIEAATIIHYVDQGRIELAGSHLQGARVRWRGGDRSGEDACLVTKPPGKSERCTVAVPRDLPVDAAFGLVPPGAPAPGVGASAALAFRPARVVVDRLLPVAATVDLSSGSGRIPLTHPEAVAAADCPQASCELTENAIVVRAAASAAATLTLRLRLIPHYLLARGELLEPATTRTIAVLHCPAANVSGPPLRRADATKVIVRLDDRCGHDARDLRWTVNGREAEARRVERVADAVYAELVAGEIEDAQVTVMATRREPDDAVIAVVRSETRSAPQPRATLELPGYGKIAFLPTNRDAILRTAPVGDHGRLVPLSVDGAYHVVEDAHDTRLRGEESAGGSAALRFGYRVDSLPPSFAETDLAVVAEPIQRPIREASVPAPLGSSVSSATPILELLCADSQGHAERIQPGGRASIAFSQRDSCRLLIHRERLTAEQGTQDIALEVNVTKLDDAPRTEAHVSERMVLRPGPQPRVFWIHGVKDPFDRIDIRVTHIIDEGHDVGGTDLHTNLSAAQWAVVVGEGHFRFYATAAIPTGLFRITAPSDVLTLNFGALSRLTWLDREGHEGLVGLEFGALGIGLAATPGFPRTLAVLSGVGVGVPIGNRGEKTQASVNLHAWLAYELRDAYHLAPTDPRSRLASHLAFLFGPSITIGNVGTNL